MDAPKGNINIKYRVKKNKPIEPLKMLT